MRSDFAIRLAAQGYGDNIPSSRLANVGTVERAFDESLDDIVARGGLDTLVAQLRYSKADERSGRQNPSPVQINGNLYNGLATLRNGVMLYCRFLDAERLEPATAPLGASITANQAFNQALPPDEPLERQRLSLERDMQTALRRDITRLEPGLEIVDDGAERAVDSGFIDILARDADGTLVVIELKAGRTDARVIGQMLGYMGDIAQEEDAKAVRGIIVAHDFDQRTKSAVRAVPNLALVRYAVWFTFTPEGASE